MDNVLSHLQNGKWPDKISDDIKPYYNKQNKLTIVDGVILCRLQVIYQNNWASKELKELHQNHAGISRMKSLSRIHIRFPNINHKIENIVQSCQNCEEVSNEQSNSQTHPCDWPTKLMDWIHINYFEYNKKVIVDSYGKWLDFELVSHCDTKNTTLCLSKWFSQHGIPIPLISDNGTQFTSQEFENFIKTLNQLWSNIMELLLIIKVQMVKKRGLFKQWSMAWNPLE